MYEQFVNLITNVGFPIACVVALAYYVTQLEKTHKEEVDALAKSFTDIVDEVKELSNKVTTLIEEFRNEVK